MKESSQASKSASAASHHHLHAPFALSLGDVELELFQSSELQLRYLHVPDLTLQYNTCPGVHGHAQYMYIIRIIISSTNSTYLT